MDSYAIPASVTECSRLTALASLVLAKSSDRLGAAVCLPFFGQCADFQTLDMEHLTAGTMKLSQYFRRLLRASSYAGRTSGNSEPPSRQLAASCCPVSVASGPHLLAKGSVNQVIQLSSRPKLGLQGPVYEIENSRIVALLGNS